MSTNAELEILLKRAINLLHSTEANSAQELRAMLDEEIQKRYGSERILSNTLRKKHLEAEANFPGRAVTPPPPAKPPTESEVINLINSPTKTISDSPDTIMDSDDAVTAQITDSCGLISGTQITDTVTVTEDETNLKEFGDLNCCVCAEMMFTATNRLIECVKCGALYHQECHKPAISDDEIADEQAHNWQCDNCLNKPTTTKAAGIVVISDEPAIIPLAAAVGSSITSFNKSKSSATSSRSSSSNSSSSFYKGDHATANSVQKPRDVKPSATATSVITTAATENNVQPHTQNISTFTTTSTSSSKRSLPHSHSSSSSSSNKSKSRHHDNKKRSSK